MKVKIIEPGWHGLTGQFGVHEFVDGVSVESISDSDARSLASLISIVGLDDEGNETGNPSDSQAILDTYHHKAAVERLKSVEELDAEAAAAGKLTSTDIVVEKHYTAEELAEVADKEGIKGLRKIADPIGVKANSIAELIGKIVDFQRDHPVNSTAS